MKYPAGQSAKAIPDELLPFVEPFDINTDRSWVINRNKDDYQLFHDGNLVERYCKSSLDRIDLRLHPTIMFLHNKFQHQFVYGMLRHNIRCWYEAICYKADYPVKHRYLFDRVEALARVGTDAERVKIKLKLFDIDKCGIDAEKENIQRENVVVSGLFSYEDSRKWVDLEEMWPGIYHRFSMADALGLTPEETALYCFEESVNQISPNTLTLPSDLNNIEI